MVAVCGTNWSINQSTKMAPPEENVQNQQVPQNPQQTVVFNDIAGVKAPNLSGTQMTFQGHSGDSRDIASSCSQPYIRKHITKGESELYFFCGQDPKEWRYLTVGHI